MLLAYHWKYLSLLGEWTKLKTRAKRGESGEVAWRLEVRSAMAEDLSSDHSTHLGRSQASGTAAPRGTKVSGLRRHCPWVHTPPTIYWYNQTRYKWIILNGLSYNTALRSAKPPQYSVPTTSYLSPAVLSPEQGELYPTLSRANVLQFTYFKITGYLNSHLGESVLLTAILCYRLFLKKSQIR